MPAYLERLFDHAFWADDLALGLLRAWPEGHEEETRCRVVRLVSHLLAAERVWLLRPRGEDAASQPIWPELTLAELETMREANGTAYSRFLAALTERDLEREVEYRNSAGVTFRTPVIDILVHVALHGSYHRGQVAREVREAGLQPVNTDYITYVRRAREPS